MKPVLVTGASGYVGARLVARLRARGLPVRATGRSAERLAARPFAADPGVERVACDLRDPESVRRACSGCSAVYYLVHSMDAGQGDFREADREAARTVARASAREGVNRIIYLGGLGEPGAGMSEHLRSRAEVGGILSSGAVPTTVLRAAMIIGAGSGSFEILRHLVDRLPVMITPRWISTESQPIAIRNVIDILAGCLDAPGTRGETFDIGGPEVTSYRRLMEIYAEEAGLPRRLVFPVPVLSPRLSSLWIDLVTPAPAALARPLAEGLGSRVVCSEDRIRAHIPVTLLSCRAAIRAALDGGGRRALLDGTGPPGTEEGIIAGDPPWTGGTVFTDHRRIVLAASSEEVFEPLRRIGGETGWYSADRLWTLRGAIGRPTGGAGVGSRALGLSPGDVADSWRVEAVEPARMLRLAAEVKLPGAATLEFLVRPAGAGATELHQISRFFPRGLSGIVYRRAVAPLHRVALAGLLRRIARAVGKPLLGGPDALDEGTARTAAIDAGAAA